MQEHWEEGPRSSLESLPVVGGTVELVECMWKVVALVALMKSVDPHWQGVRWLMLGVWHDAQFRRGGGGGGKRWW